MWQLTVKTLTIILLELLCALQICLCDHASNGGTIMKGSLVHYEVINKRDTRFYPHDDDFDTKSDVIKKAHLVHVGKLAKTRDRYDSSVVFDYSNINTSAIVLAEFQAAETTEAENLYYKKNECNCGLNGTDYIIGGEPVSIEEYPWMVQLVTKNSLELFCGGTIINDLYVLTAAHCLATRPANRILVRYGHESSYKKGGLVKVEKHISHERFNYSIISIYDIALVKVAEKFLFTSSVQPICLFPDFDYDSAGIVAGWGYTTFVDGEEGEVSDVLKAAYVNIYDHEHCLEISHYTPEDLNDMVLCGSEEGIDACQGDSGGPLMTYHGEENRYNLVGITSWGVGCAKPNFPGIYTKVPKYRKWIFDNTKYAKYCRP